MKNIISIIAFSIFAFSFTNAQTLENKVLAKVGTDNVTYGRLEAAFQKNMSGEKKKLYELDKDSLHQFLNLFIDYRLKVKDAIDRGYDKEPEVSKEIQQNNRLLTESFYYDKKVFQPVVDKLLDRRQYYIKFAYVLFPYTQEAEGMTQTDPKELAQSVLDSIINKKISFAEAAKNHAKEKTLADNGGIVERYLISGTIQRPIEEALFTISVNQIYPTILETSYGYFLLKLVEKQPRKQVLAGHILISNMQEQLSDVEHKKADSLLKLLRKGANFEKLAELNSADHASAINGGSLGDYYDLATGFVKTRAFLEKNFIDAFMKLKDGEISDTIHTAYGIHIIKRIDSKSPDRTIDEKDVKDYYKKSAYDDDKKAYYEDFVSSNGLNIEQETMNSLLSNVNYTKTNLDSNWAAKIPNDKFNDKLFSFKKDSWTLGEFIGLLSDKSKTEYRATALNREGIQGAIYKIVKPQVMTMWQAELEKQDTEFRNLLTEFHDGILLFKVEAIEVWDKLQLDTAMALDYFNTSGQKFMTNEKYDVSEIFVIQDSLAQSLYNRAKAGEDFAELATKFTVRQGYRELSGYHGELDANDNKFSRQLNGEDIKEGTIIAPKVYQSGYSIIKINKVIKPRVKNFEEAIPDLAPAVQQLKQKKLVKNWLKDVREKHKVEIFEKTINEIYANKSK
ncbi:MAG: peptidylprolyl isomerase [Candidatus Kapaibacterium sp.]